MLASAPWAAALRWHARARQRWLRIDPRDVDPVVLRHRRIYILPTPRGLAFMGTIATMLVLSLNYAMSLGFAMTFLLSGLAGAALLHTFRHLAGLSLRPLGAGETFAAIRCRSRWRSAAPSARGDHRRRRRRRAGAGRPRRRRHDAGDVERARRRDAAGWPWGA
jgi:hypothetical protein